MITLLKTFFASAIVVIVLALVFAVVSLARAKFMTPEGGTAPHTCADGCATCMSHCDNYHVDELKEEIKANVNLN